MGRKTNCGREPEILFFICRMSFTHRIYERNIITGFQSSYVKKTKKSRLKVSLEKCSPSVNKCKNETLNTRLCPFYFFRQPVRVRISLGFHLSIKTESKCEQVLDAVLFSSCYWSLGESPADILASSRISKT